MDGLVGELGRRRERAYYTRVRYRLPWVQVAKACGYTTGRGAQEAARVYAEENNKPWPVVALTKGACIYMGRRYGVTWMKMSRIYRGEIKQLQQCAYKWASRNGYAWPPGG